ncbi:MAG: HD family phosphohydrolase [Candidatus Promineifilaceae bacterium]|jgi:putative nucleotidyltransferase with HDIG domain
MEALPATRQQLRETFRGFRLLVFASILTLGMTLILSFNLVWTSQVNVVVGEPAPDDVFAPTFYSYISTVLTEKAREQARNSVTGIYTPLDSGIGREQLEQANAIFSFIETVRNDPLATTEDKIAYIQSINGLEISEEVAADLIAFSQAEFNTVNSEITRIVDDLMREEIREDQLGDFQRIARRQASLGLTQAQSNVVTNMAWQFIAPTVFPDEEATSAARDQAAEAVQPVTRSVAKDQRIVRAGEIVTEEDYELMGQLGLLRQEFDWRVLLSAFLISLLSVVLIGLYWQKYHTVEQNSSRYLAVLTGLILIFTLAARLMASTTGNWPLLFPLAALSMLLAVVFELRFSILITVIVAAIFGISAPNSLLLAVYTAVGGLIAILTLRDSQRIVSYFRAGLLAVLGQVAVLLIFTLSQIFEPVDFLTQAVYALGNGLLSAAVTLVGFFVLGSAFGIITTVQLQDLSRLDHPLLQELLRRAPGTYHHSIMVANLAEQAAERVNANSTLVRVGAFYHDIGKMNRPAFFTENQEGVNPHDSLDPYTSARIIINHVPDGLELAKRFRLPNRIKDFIAEHHGTRIVKGFYHKARMQAGEKADEVDAEKFRYPGPLPHTRECGIVMMADAIEATSSALRPDTPQAIEKLVNTIVDDDVMEGQLKNSGLTLGDIEIIRSSFIDTLKGRFHVRVRYPGNERIDAPQTAVGALPEPSAPEVLVAGNQEKAEVLYPQEISSD